MEPAYGMIIRSKQTKTECTIAEVYKDYIVINIFDGNKIRITHEEFKKDYDPVVYKLKANKGSKEPYEAPKVEFISFEEIYRLTEKTIPIRASEIENIPDELKGMRICPYCWEPLLNPKKSKYHNYCPGCGRKVAE